MGTPGQDLDSRFAAMWRGVCEALRAEMDPQRFAYWISSLRVVSASASNVVIECRSPFFRDQTVAKFGPRIAELIAERIQGLDAIDFVTDPLRQGAIGTSATGTAPPGLSPRASETQYAKHGATRPPRRSNDVSHPKAPQVKIEDIKRCVAERFQLAGFDLESSSRERQVARSRRIAMYIARNLSGKSYAEIGRRFGGRNPGTIVYGCKKIARDCERDSATAGEIQSLIGLVVSRSCTPP